MIRNLLFLFFLYFSLVKISSSEENERDYISTQNNRKIEKKWEYTQKDFESSEQKDYFQGFSVGFNFGYSMIENLDEANLKNNNYKGKAFNGNVTKELRHAISTSLNIGYGISIQNTVYAGIELDIGYRFLTNANSSDVYINGNQTYYNNEKISMPLNFGAVIKLGFIYNDKNLIYVLGGYDLVTFNSSYKSYATTTNSSLNNSLTQDQEITDVSTYLSGFRIGLGYEKIILSEKNVSIGWNSEIYYKQYFSKDLNMKNKITNDTLEIEKLNGLELRTGLKIRFDI